MTPKELKVAYDSGKNITEILRHKEGVIENSEEIIEMAYDLQAGSYVKLLNDQGVRSHKVAYGKEIATIIKSLTDVRSVLEPGVGEGTTLSFVLEALCDEGIIAHGFDISWSRVNECRRWLLSQNCQEAHLSIASIFAAPYLDNSFDVVYTSHTIEPNGGRESEILSELHRITSRYLLLFEPGYELATDMAKARMERLGYCKGLQKSAEDLGMRVIKHEFLSSSVNPMNPTAVTVIEKSPDAPAAKPQFACPRHRNKLDLREDSWFSSDSLRAYPKIKGIPCLRIEDGVVASFYDKWK